MSVFMVNRKYQLLCSDIAPNLIISSVWCRVSNFSVKNGGGLPYTSDINIMSEFEGLTRKCSVFPFLLTSHVLGVENG